nr:tRNA (N6-threonylcarbamoyladenosine(37)-N6)-methyltransferase TrmO [Lachnospiraceae bacterium]
NKRDAVIGILKEDPRPGYQNDSSRRYGVSYAGYDIRFYVDGDDLNVVEVVKL